MKRVPVVRKVQTEEQSVRFQQMREKLFPMLRQQAECYREAVIPGLAELGILLRRWVERSDAQREEAS
jgi:hypothetical protein